MVNDEDDGLSSRSYSSQANSSRSLCSWDSFNSENSHIGGPDIEERRDKFWYRKVFADSGRKDAAAVPPKKNVSSSGIPKPRKFLSRIGRAIRKSAPKANDGQVDEYAPVILPFAETESSDSAIIAQLPRFQDVPIFERNNLFLKKLELCCIVYDFADHKENVEAKDIKRKTLVELVDYVEGVDVTFEEEIEQSIKMASINLFKPPPHVGQRCEEAEASQENQEELAEFDFVDPEVQSKHLIDPAWPHKQLVYEFLLQFVRYYKTHTNLATRYIDCFFLIRLMDLFDHPDPREREYVKIILHRIYGAFMVRRPFLRRIMNNMFCEFMNDTERHNGIAELLEVLASIISGFSLPLKDEYKLTLFRVLMPLHKTKTLAMYSKQLTYCITRFLEKDPTLAAFVITRLLKNWPQADWSKEVLLLGELEEILEATRPGYGNLETSMGPLFRRIAQCIQSPHHKVAKRALSLWDNNCVINLITEYHSVILPIIYPALDKNRDNHWNQTVLSLSMKVKEILYNIDSDTFAACQKMFERKQTST